MNPGLNKIKRYGLAGQESDPALLDWIESVESQCLNRQAEAN